MFLEPLVAERVELEYVVTTPYGERNVLRGLDEAVHIDPYGFEIPVMLVEETEYRVIDTVDFTLTLKVGEETLLMNFIAIRIVKTHGDLTFEAYYDNETKVLLYASIVDTRGLEIEVRLHRVPYYPITLNDGSTKVTLENSSVTFNPETRCSGGGLFVEVAVVALTILLITLITLKTIGLV